MSVCKKFAKATCDLVKQQENGTSGLTQQEFSEKLIMYTEGKLEPCKSCKRQDKCHKSI